MKIEIILILKAVKRRMFSENFKWLIYDPSDVDDDRRAPIFDKLSTTLLYIDAEITYIDWKNRIFYGAQPFNFSILVYFIK